MKLFEVVRRHYAILGISQSAQNTSLDRKVLSGFLLFGCSVVSQFVYIFLVANGFMEYMVCICTTCGTIITFVGFASVAFKKTLVFESMDSLGKFIDSKRKYPGAKALLLETSRQVERLSEIIFKLSLKISLQLTMLPKCVVSYGVYFTTDSGRDSFELPGPMWFPFDVDNPIGYLVAVILEYILMGYAHLIIACILAVGIGAYLFAISIIRDIQCILHSINKKAHAKKSRTDKLKMLFVEFIDTHAAIKHLMHDFSGIFQPIIMLLFTWSLLAISCVMLIVQMEIFDHENLMSLLPLILCGVLALALVFICCELGQRTNDAFDEMNSTIDQLNWYLFPIEIKRILPMIIAIVQEPVSIECFGSIRCTRDVFKNIIHHAFSYSMVLRQLGE